ncbi:MAG TPA: hypothetical protein VFF52_31285 [Isosphaeraceae bacterium]|nr:hypothetical protein [Isosphaeraceae bacterium]
MRVVVEGLRGSSLMTGSGVVPREATARPLTMISAARVFGRVVTTLPGTSVSGVEVHVQGSRGPGGRVTNQGGQTTTDDQSRFWFRGLDEGTAKIFLAATVGMSPGPTVRLRTWRSGPARRPKSRSNVPEWSRS